MNFKKDTNVDIDDKHFGFIDNFMPSEASSDTIHHK